MGKQHATSSQVIAHLKSVFARHGIPKTLVSDNGPQFASEKFRQFLKDWEIQYDLASPRYPKLEMRAVTHCSIFSTRQGLHIQEYLWRSHRPMAGYTATFSCHCRLRSYVFRINHLQKSGVSCTWSFLAGLLYILFTIGLGPRHSLKLCIREPIVVISP